MKIFIYLKSGQIVECYADSTPELTINRFTGQLSAYNISNLTGTMQPLYIDPSEINAVVVDTSRTNTITK